eukprot:TRINITY_DN33861_c0_g1_i2.p2 TRINITY_DN33861_c0_g1~~TRINITY_DN33861_c0_g1_i2.p2  ORF type:complete len:167 (-),score=48.34 TRINITY_DN33861_c0_g1_i2:29-529(-)
MCIRDRSMNYVVGMAMYQLQAQPLLPQREVYWFTRTLFADLIPEYHTRDMHGVQVDTRVLNQLLGELHPRTAQALLEESVSPEVLCVEWLLGLHTTTLPLSAAACLWDVLLSRGRNHLLRTCLALLNWAGDPKNQRPDCLLYTSDAADEEDSVDLGGWAIIKKTNR